MNDLLSVHSERHVTRTLSCHHCGVMYRRPVLAPGEWATCLRCGGTLETYAAFSASAWFAVLIATVITFILANAFPVATLFVQGAGQAASFIDAVVVTWQVGYPEVAVLTFAAGFFLPACHLGLLIWIFGALAFGEKFGLRVVFLQHPQRVIAQLCQTQRVISLVDDKQSLFQGRHVTVFRNGGLCAVYRCKVSATFKVIPRNVYFILRQ